MGLMTSMLNDVGRSPAHEVQVFPPSVRVSSGARVPAEPYYPPHLAAATRRLTAIAPRSPRERRWLDNTSVLRRGWPSTQVSRTTKRLVPIFVWASLVCCLRVTCADVVELTNGKEVSGEILEDVPGKPLVFRYAWAGQWKTTEVERNRIRSYRREPGNQADKPASQEPSPAGEDEGNAANPKAALAPAALPPRSDIKRADVEKILRDFLPHAPEGGGEVVVISLVGPFRAAAVALIGDIVSSVEVSLMIDVAKGRHPAAIVLFINSAGGLVDEEEAIIERLIAEQSPPSNTRMVAWVDLGGSAAALAALACREIVMLPTGRIGSATMTIDDVERPEPDTAIDQKQRAMEDARRRQVVNLTGRSLALHEAMEFPEKKIWAHATKGFSTSRPVGDGWVALDGDDKRPLAMSAEEMVKYRVAIGIAGSDAELLNIMKLPKDTPVQYIDLSDPAFQKLIAPAKEAAVQEYGELKKARSALDSKLDRLWDNLVLAKRAANAIALDEDGYTVVQLQTLQTALGRCRVPTIAKDDREILSTQDPERLRQVEIRMDFMRTKVLRAIASAKQKTLPIGAIISDINEAMKWVYIARWNMPPPEADE